MINFAHSQTGIMLDFEKRITKTYSEDVSREQHQIISVSIRLVSVSLLCFCTAVTSYWQLCTVICQNTSHIRMVRVC